MILNPDFPKGYIRYIVALKACKEVILIKRVSDVYMKRFPGFKDRELLRKALEICTESLSYIYIVF